MHVRELTSRYARVFHIAQPGSWPSIRAHGLLSSAALCELFGVPFPERRRLLEHRRPQFAILKHPDYGRAVLRDNAPLSTAKLARVLEDVSLRDWFRLLNRKVFFWPTRDRARQILNTRAYRDGQHNVIVVDLASLVERHAGRISLSPINTGATLYTPARRGIGTFRSIEEYPFEDRLRRRPSLPIAEIVVDWAIPDLAEVALRVERWQRGQPTFTVWDRATDRHLPLGDHER